LFTAYWRVGDEALWIWSHALIASTLGAQGGSNALGAFAGEPVIEPNIAALAPAEVLEALPESRKVADPPDALRLLYARR
jgi:hypothetical protein